eukprot:2406339-Amphidinium_carterae.1
MDADAQTLRSRRNNARGLERITLSKQLYAHLKRMRMQRMLEGLSKNNFSAIFPKYNQYKAKRKTVLVNEQGRALTPTEGLQQLQKKLGQKIQAIPMHDCPDIPPIMQQCDTTDIVWPTPQQY